MQSLGSDPTIIDRLVKSVCPNIFGLEDIKKGILCQVCRARVCMYICV
jgi:DNA replicative helicase MCM subunit Mcm2 (Cdc46/Mcm family)